MNVSKVEQALLGVRNQLKNHSVYGKLTSVADIKIFMESHVYAVWDFMSLLKALQIQLTCTSLPWKPVANAATARFINEIVLEEETDINELGQPKSHFEMYLDAMEEVGANTQAVTALIKGLTANNIATQIAAAKLHPAEKAFLQFTFEVIQTQKPHIIAAAFTFGREEVIPDMFLEIIEQSTQQGGPQFPKLTYYLKRHIELDGDEHGPLALRMIQELCGADEQKWKEVATYGKIALEKRLQLWDGILEQLSTKPTLMGA